MDERAVTSEARHGSSRLARVPTKAESTASAAQGKRRGLGETSRPWRKQ
jgi:hypothetical protein